MTPEQRAAEVQQLRREYPGWTVWFARPAPELAGSYYARRAGRDGPAEVATRTAGELRAALSRRDGM